MTTAIVSQYTQRQLRPRIAMTGEMTLRGKVLPVGGIKEKILAAKRAGITDIILSGEIARTSKTSSRGTLQGLSSIT